MVAIPYGIGTYRRSDLPQVELVNMYVEKAPSPPQKSPVVLLPRPALQARSTLGSGPIRGIYQQNGVLNGTSIVVSGSTLYANGASLGGVGAATRAIISGDTGGVMIASGNLYRYDGTTKKQIAFPDGAAVIWTGYLAGYWFAVRKNSRRIYFTLDPYTWDGADYISAEQSPGNIVGAQLVGDQLWIFSDTIGEVFVTTGISDMPLQSMQGRVFDKGAYSQESISAFDNTVVWVSEDRVVYRAAGTPVRISDHGIEERLAASASASAWRYFWLGHEFYVLNLDSETVAYDAATQQWHECSSYGVGGWRVANTNQGGAATVVGDAVDGTLWALVDGVYQDGGKPIVRVFSAIINSPGIVDNLVVNFSSGETAAPTDPMGVLELRTSRNGGMHWTNWRQVELGAQGRYRTRVGFRRVGMVDADDLLCQLRITDNRPSRVTDVRVNEPLAGRSR